MHHFRCMLRWIQAQDGYSRPALSAVGPVVVGLAVNLAVSVGSLTSQRRHGWVRDHPVTPAGAWLAAPAVRGARQRLGRWPRSSDYVASALKRPDRTMAGSWIDLHDRPVGPARSRVTASLAAATPSSLGPDEHPVQVRA